MTITQTVEVPNNRQIIIDVPKEIPTGRVILTFTPMAEPVTKVQQSNTLEMYDSSPITDMIEFVDASSDDVNAAGDEILNKHITAFKALAK
jgi:hypothetical protein